MVRRRDLILGICGTTTAWPLVARAQGRMRRIGVLVNGLEDDPALIARVDSFNNALKKLGWTNGANVQIDYRFGKDDDDLLRRAEELVKLAPSVVLANAPPSVKALRQANRAVPIVFVAVTDPVGLGIVQSLARPGGNATGFLSAEFGFGAKSLELLKDIAPGVRRVGILTALNNPFGIPQFASIQTTAQSFNVEVLPLDVQSDTGISNRMSDFARSANAGLIALRISEVITRRKSIIRLAAQHRLPAVYPLPIFAKDGGLISYGPDVTDQFRRAASYIDRILKGESPADLPVQAPTEYELVINLKTAKALGLDMPSKVLVRANEVIE